MTHEHILKLYCGLGSTVCDGEGLTLLQHAWQCARLAERAGASDALRLAAWLHDLGHLLAPPAEVSAHDVRRNTHELLAGEVLTDQFGAAVGMPVLLHVQAKRYLVAAHPVYADRLSAGSKRSLALQGGPMDAADIQAFRSAPWSDDALRLRIWDDVAKMKDWEPSDWELELAELAQLMQRVATAAFSATTGATTGPGMQGERQRLALVHPTAA